VLGVHISQRDFDVDCVDGFYYRRDNVAILLVSSFFSPCRFSEVSLTVGSHQFLYFVPQVVDFVPEIQFTIDTEFSAPRNSLTVFPLAIWVRNLELTGFV